MALEGGFDRSGQGIAVVLFELLIVFYLFGIPASGGLAVYKFSGGQLLANLTQFLRRQNIRNLKQHLVLFPAHAIDQFDDLRIIATVGGNVNLVYLKLA